MTTNSRHSKLKFRITSSFYQFIRLVVLMWMTLSFVSCSNESADQTETNTKKISVGCSECPSIQENEDTLAYINRVRRYVAKNVDTGLFYNKELDSLSNVSDDKLNLERVLQLFAADSGVALCALTARINARILNDNGVEAYVYNFGFEGTELTHVLNLVKYQEQLIVVDPYLNYILIDSSGNPIRFMQLLKGDFYEHKLISYQGNPVNFDILVDYHNENLRHRIDSLSGLNHCKELFSSRIFVRDSVYHFSGSRCVTCPSSGCDSFISKFEIHLRENHKLNHFWEGYKFKIGPVTGGENANKIDSLVNQILLTNQKNE